VDVAMLANLSRFCINKIINYRAVDKLGNTIDFYLAISISGSADEVISEIGSSGRNFSTV
jgi:hypothetical protein